MSEEVTDAASVEAERQARLRVKANLAHKALNAPPKQANGALILLLTAIAFFATTSRDRELVDFAILVGVLLLHEGGHLLGMWAFGFSDLRMFFLPFFGAAVTGRKPGASAVAQSIVSLLGPVPGILIALAMAFFVDIDDSTNTPLPTAAQAVVMLVLVNGFNLLPILPLDGGRLFQTLLFGRTPVLDLLFRGAAIAGLGWLAFRGTPILGVLAIFMLVGLHRQAKVAVEAARLRRTGAFTPDVAALGDEALAALFDAALRATSHLRGSEATRNPILAGTMRDLFDRAAQANANWWQTVLLLLVWLLAVGAGMVALLVLVWPKLHH